MPFHSQRKRFKSLQKEKCMKRGKGGSGITQEDGPYLRYKGRRACRLRKGNAVIAFIWLRKRREPAGSLPVKGASFHNNSSHRRSVPADKFSSRMDYNIRAVRYRLHKIRSREGIIHHQGDFMGMGYAGNPFDIHHIGIRIPPVSPGKQPSYFHGLHLPALFRQKDQQR